MRFRYLSGLILVIVAGTIRTRDLLRSYYYAASAPAWIDAGPTTTANQHRPSLAEIEALQKARLPIEEWQYPEIDVVYTWVNGSDPIWLETKETYTLSLHDALPISPPLK